MTGTLTTPVLLGLDGFIACLALRLLGLNPGAVPLAVWCGLCDGLALLAGTTFPLSPLIGPGVWPVLIGAGAALAGLLMVWRLNLIVSLLPVLLALDNFLFGAATNQFSGVLDAAVSGMVSAALAATGLLSGDKMADRLGPRRARLAGGGILLATGFAAVAG